MTRAMATYSASDQSGSAGQRQTRVDERALPPRSRQERCMMSMLKLSAPDGAGEVAAADWVPTYAMLALDRVTPAAGRSARPRRPRSAPRLGRRCYRDEGRFPHQSDRRRRARARGRAGPAPDRQRRRPVGAPIDLTPCRCGGTVFDQAVAQGTAPLLTAAERVLACWARRSMAATVRALNAALRAMRMPVEARPHPRPQASPSNRDHP